MNKVLDPIKSFLARFRRPQGEAAPRQKMDRFTLVSWGVTWVIVLAALGFAFWKTQGSSAAATTVLPTAPPDAAQPNVALPAPVISSGTSAIDRSLQLKTLIPERPRYAPIVYRVSSGDAMLAIADRYQIKAETLYYVNNELEDNPHNLRPGMELTIPPVDGLYYEWKEGDTLEAVSAKYNAKPEDILNFPANNLDLTDPKIEPGAKIMIPGGSRELANWEKQLPTGSSSNNACGGGPVDTSLGWPADAHSLSGNPYGPGHLGIDITAPEGANVYAAGAGVVTMAQGGWNYGYGNVVQVDHGNGWVTVYAHLSVIYVSTCMTVGQGTVVGLAGNTGNSFGAHLHFEIRIGGTNVNPYDYVQ